MSGAIYRWGYAGKRFVSRLRDARRYGIPSKGLVLDLGSGQDPHPRANILCDRFVIDSSERACGGGLLIDRPIVLADATATPFPDRAFDFVFCSHLLEHMDDPALLLNELQRISKAGYIETPSKIYEKLWGWDFHKWFVSVENKRLILETKPRVVFDDDLHRWWGRQIEREDVWRFVIPRLTDLGLITRLVWTDEIAYEIRGEDTGQMGFRNAAEDIDQTVDALHDVATPDLSKTQRAKKLVSGWQRRHSDPLVKDLFERLLCPRCRAPLAHEGESWSCSSCGATYTSTRGIPVLLAAPDGDREDGVGAQQRSTS